MKLKEYWKKYRVYLVLSVILVAGGSCLLLYARPEEVQPDIVVSGQVSGTGYGEVESMEESERGESSESGPEFTESTIETASVKKPGAGQSEAVAGKQEPEESITEVSEEVVLELELEQAEVSEETPQPTSIPEILPEVTKEACTHNWIFTSYFQEPTCGNGGLENQVCAVCGETQTTSGTPTSKHTFVVETPGDCCTEEILRCSACNYREVGSKDTENHMDVEDDFCYGCGQEVKASE